MSNLYVQPQAGPQSDFYHNKADIIIYGGQAGGGKTHGLLIAPAPFVTQFNSINAVLLRRKSKDLDLPGGLWAEAQKIYPKIGGKSNEKTKTFKFKDHSRIQFAGMLHEQDMFDWKGSQIDILEFDELTEFTEDQFWFMIGRTRSTSGNVNPFTRCATNPEPNWVCDLIKWWLTDDGFADRSKSGIIRWFYRDPHNSVLRWFDSKEQAYEGIREYFEAPQASKIHPQSLTFIPASLDDNQILMQNDPMYYSKLMSIKNPVERKQLLEGNWFVRPTGKVFKVDDFQNFALDPEYEVVIMTVDTAQNTKSANDYTVMHIWGRFQNKAYLKEGVRGKFDFMQQIEITRNLYHTHKPHWVMIECAANGHPLRQMLRKEGIPVMEITRTKDKYARALDVQGYIQSGYVYLNRERPYYPELIAELTTFSENARERAKLGMHDDQVDALVDGIYYLLYNKINAPVVKESIKKTEFSPHDPFKTGYIPAGNMRSFIDSAGER